MHATVTIEIKTEAINGESEMDTKIRLLNYAKSLESEIPKTSVNIKTETLKTGYN